ncbi:flavin reductase (DIM6/NTAB) family NADH-FMN oxidoreductase RutF [Promicromonospora sp. AC04]|uniref:flavin reductase family protein n=1 Tax=Promicromonospora sp. AC04 TaxID=2135723 RepID=UPI000D339C28|nr:flavin reductase family protein [Promicromonospora sp. AC04]PUB31543.1 flavin reductase (DIM6/NTAB) family NADH-FMN oxidoreductase RutF [Promicromonospora sp. AC04]
MTAENIDLSALEELLAQQDEPQLSPEEFKTIFRNHPAGVAVVALQHEGRPVGFTATSVISVSAAPPLLAFSLASTSSSWPAISEARTLAVSFLADHQDDVSARFATSGIDRFADGGWTPLPTGEPVIDGAVSWFRARVVQRTPIGDSYLVSLRALESNLTAAGDDNPREPKASPLVYKNRNYHRLGDDTTI